MFVIENKFYTIIILGKYYLVDLGYPNEYGYLGPFIITMYNGTYIWSLEEKVENPAKHASVSL